MKSVIQPVLKISTLSLALAFAFSAQAQSTQPQSVVITARPVIEEVKVDPFSSVSAIVTEDQLRDQHALDAAAALRRTPGVQISRYNPVGSFGGDQGGAVFIRGMGVSRPGSEIKTYIDGVPFYMGVWNHPLLDLLPVNGMQAITVYKSPQPHISGNNFASINLSTKSARTQQEGSTGNVRLSAGAFGTFTEQADVVGRNGSFDYALAQGHARSNGHRKNADGQLNNALMHFGWKLNENWALATNAIVVDNKANDPGDNRLASTARPAQYNTHASMLSASLSHTHGTSRGELKVYNSSGDGNWLHQAGLDGDTLTSFRLSGLRWKEQLAPWAGGTLVFGLDHDRISGDVQYNRVSPAPQNHFDTPTFRVTSPYAAVSHNVALNADWEWQPSAGVRFYQHSEFSSKAAPHLGLSLASKEWTFFANASRGINYPGLEAPTLAGLIAPLGNSWKQLAAEELNHVEIGAKFTPNKGTQIDLSLFDDQVKNRYVFGFPPDVPPPPQFINLGSYRMRGAELALRQDLMAGWTLFSGLTLLNPSIDNLPYTPKRALTLGINGQIGPVRLALDAQYQSEVWALNRARAAGAVNGDRVAGFTVANARISYPMPAFGKKGEVFVAVENLFDRQYGYRPGYPMPGRWAQAGVSLSF